MLTTPSARLLLPRPALSACVFLGVERDTRGTALSDAQRFNHYPASPMAVVSWVFEGSLHMVQGNDHPVLGPPVPRLSVAGPQRRPVSSWSPGPVHALSVAFYPDALARLLRTGVEALLDRILPLDEVASGPLLAASQALLASEADSFDRFQDRLEPLWSSARPPDAAVTPLVGDWLRRLAAQAALSRPGRGVRQVQRRIKAWTGQSQRDLRVFARVDDLVLRASRDRQAGPPSLALLASEAGFADQSHMGRSFRRVTGLAPGQLEQRVATDEAFWFYRLLGERFGGW